MIFSTVFGPHEPALTVGSLAITRDVPPADQPEAGDDAVGAEPLGLPVGEQRLLGEGPSSRRRAMRSRTGSLPCSAVLARWRSGPPARARSMASPRSLTLASRCSRRTPWSGRH